LGGLTVRSPDDHDPYEASGEDAVPQAHPGLDERPGFLGVRLPRRRGGDQGLGRADAAAFFTRGAALAFNGRGRGLIELGGQSQASNHMDVAGQVT
jgi:hypothetical protein